MENFPLEVHFLFVFSSLYAGKRKEWKRKRRATRKEELGMMRYIGLLIGEANYSFFFSHTQTNTQGSVDFVGNVLERNYMIFRCNRSHNFRSNIFVRISHWTNSEI